MSTAGKVLIVLVLLLVPVWIVLASAVAQLNTEWSQAVKQAADRVAQLEKDVLKNEEDIRAWNDKIGLEQEALGQTQTVLLAQIANVERTKAETVAIQADVKVRLERLQAAVKNAERARDLRLAEKESETKGKASAEMLVGELSGQNAELMEQLTQLRNDFKSTLESNQVLVDRINKARRQPTTRSAVFVR